jgi:uncharacterized protein YdeI (BOF family)
MIRVLFFIGMTVVVFLASCLTSNVQAQQQSPAIADIQADPNRYVGLIVTLSGTVGQYVDLNEFLLSDGTGQIVTDSGPPWFRRINIPVGTPVTVIGQIDWMGPRGQRTGVDLNACRIETPTETIAIRDCSFSGPPPWAGGPRRNRP